MDRPVISVHVTNEQTELEIDPRRIEQAVRAVFEEEPLDRVEVSVAVVDDATIRQLNGRHLDHDYETDVLSFLLERDAAGLEGEVVVSAQTARSAAKRYGWTPLEELLLYVVHGTLHLLGHEDQTEDQRIEMRALERACLARLGLEPPYEEQDADES